MCKSHRLSEQILRCHFFAASYTKIFYSSYNVPDALTPQTFLTETCWGPKTPPAGTGTLASSPATSRSPARPRPADPRTRHAPARTDPRGPEPAGGGVLRRARLAPGVRGPAQREGSGPRAPRFSKTPTWRRPPPPATTTPPRGADGPGTARGGARKVSLLLSRPARGRRTTNPGFTYPARRGRRRRKSDSSSSRAPGADSAGSPAPASQGVCGAVPRSRPDLVAKDGRPAGAAARRWLPRPSSRTPQRPPGLAFPLRAHGRAAAHTPGASARARAHPHRSRPALSCRFPRPARAALRDALEGAGPP